MRGQARHKHEFALKAISGVNLNRLISTEMFLLADSLDKTRNCSKKIKVKKMSSEMFLFGDSLDKDRKVF